MTPLLQGDDRTSLLYVGSTLLICINIHVCSPSAAMGRAHDSRERSLRYIATGTPNGYICDTPRLP